MTAASPSGPSHIIMNLHNPHFDRLQGLDGKPETQFDTLFGEFFKRFFLGDDVTTAADFGARQLSAVKSLQGYFKKIAITALEAKASECEIPLSSLDPSLETASEENTAKARALCAPIDYVFNNVIEGTKLTSQENEGKITLKLAWQDAKVFQPKVTQVFTVKFPNTDENLGIYETQISQMPEFEGEDQGDPRKGQVRAYFVGDNEEHLQNVAAKIRTYKDFTAEKFVEKPEDPNVGDPNSNKPPVDNTNPDTNPNKTNSNNSTRKSCTVDGYIFSKFAKSEYCHDKAEDLHRFVRKQMLDLNRKGGGYTFLSHIISPFVGIGALLSSVCLRIGSIIEPILGIFSDLGAAAYFRSPRPALNCIYRVGHVFNNALYNGIISIPKDVIKLGLGATVVGPFFTSWAYSKI